MMLRGRVAVVATRSNRRGTCRWYRQFLKVSDGAGGSQTFSRFHTYARAAALWLMNFYGNQPAAP